MNRVDRAVTDRPTAEIIDFDAALLNACAPHVRQDLLTEADMLAQAFAPEGQPDELEALARSLSSSTRYAEMGRTHARRLAAALRHLARDAA